METQSFITNLEKLLAEDDLISVGRDAQDLKGKFYDFILEQERKEQVKKLAKSSQPYNSAAVLGAGIMGGGIAYQNAVKSIPVVMKDINQNAIDLGFDQAVSNLAGKFKKSGVSVDKVASVLTKITPALDYSAISDADIVIEAVVEHPKIKADV